MNRRKVPTLMGGVMLAESAAFALGSLLHIALKIGPLDEPKIVPAMIVEGLCAIVLLTGGVAVLRSTWNAWEMAISAQYRRPAASRSESSRWRRAGAREPVSMTLFTTRFCRRW